MNDYTDRAALADPVLCGEDHQHNLRQATELAPVYCGACADYHIVINAERLSGRSLWNLGGREALAGIVRSLLSAHDGGADPIDIVVGGTADTTLLSTCVQSAYAVGRGIFARARFAVVDRCRTPLELCRDYAARHGLRLTTSAADITATEQVIAADILVLHSVLNYIPTSGHVQALRICGRGLKRDGRILLWNQLDSADERARNALHRAEAMAAIRALVDSGAIALAEPRDAFMARLDRYIGTPRPGLSRFSSSAALRDICEQAGLPVISVDETSFTVGMPDGVPMTKRYAVAILGAPAGDLR